MFSSFGATSAAGQFVKRKPLVRFEASEKATIVSELDNTTPRSKQTKRSQSSEAGAEDIQRREDQPKKVRLQISSMAKVGRKSKKRSVVRMVQVRSSSRIKRKRGKRAGSGSSKKKPRMVKGRLQIRVGGYTGVQKIPPSALMKYLPTVKLKAAAKKLLSQSVTSKKSRPASKKRRRTKKRKTTK